MVEKSDISDRHAPPRRTPALLYEMMRSFTALARTLNLSQAVDDISSTRQTLRRHIAQLEEAMGTKLFEVDQRRYGLTDAGARALRPAQLLLDQGSVWYQGQFQNVDGMLRFSYESEAGWSFHQQQLPLSAVWSGSSALHRTAVKAWAQSEGKLESANMEPIRPYIMGYRENAEGWICVEVGEKSFYTTWFGWAHARSSVGRNLNEFPGGAEFASLANAPFTDIKHGHSVRFDQIATLMRLSEDGPMHHIVFNRVLMGVQMPDGSPAIVSVVDRASDVRIIGLDPCFLEQMPARAKVEFDN